MTDIRSLEQTLLENLPWNRARIKCVARFLRHFEMPYAEVAEFVVRMLRLPGPYVLALDRTNWKVGAVDLNILMLSIVYRSTGVPVVWIVLPEAGNSDTGERSTIRSAQITRLEPRGHAPEGLRTLEPIDRIAGGGIHLGLCRWTLASQLSFTRFSGQVISLLQCRLL